MLYHCSEPYGVVEYHPEGVFGGPVAHCSGDIVPGVWIVCVVILRPMAGYGPMYRDLDTLDPPYLSTGRGLVNW